MFAPPDMDMGDRDDNGAIGLGMKWWRGWCCSYKKAELASDRESRQRKHLSRLLEGLQEPMDVARRPEPVRRKPLEAMVAQWELTKVSKAARQKVMLAHLAKRRRPAKAVEPVMAVEAAMAPCICPDVRCLCWKPIPE